MYWFSETPSRSADSMSFWWSETGMRTYAWPVGLARRGDGASLLPLGATGDILVAADVAIPDHQRISNIYAGICASVFVA